MPSCLIHEGFYAVEQDATIQNSKQTNRVLLYSLPRTDGMVV